ncbi:hypothetical protein KKG66_03225 [bacterium]|nr:hypothetical protein [bacterium]
MTQRMFILTLLALLTLAVNAWSQTVEFKLVTQKNVTAFSELQILRDELFLGSETIDRILIADILNDGFDENDMLQLYPSGRVLRLQPITARLDSLLRSYRLPANTSVFESRHYYAENDSIAVMNRGGRALGYGLLGGLEQRLQAGYRGDMVEGYFKMTQTGASIQIWNFDSTRVSFPRPSPTPRDTIIIYQADTVFVPEIVTIEKDPIVIRDTVYIPAELRQDPRGFYYREALGMAGGSFSMSKRESSRGSLQLGAGNEWDFGVWDPWISGRQDVNSRVGLRFVADMAPWSSDTLSPRFLASSFEAMYIPAWDRSFFAFGGIRAYYLDDLFWDQARAGWDEDLYDEPAQQDLRHYEITAKVGLDKLSPYGSGKKIGMWLKLSGWVGDSNYDVTVVDSEEPRQKTNWKFDHEGGYDVEAAVTARLSEFAQAGLSVGQKAIPNLHYRFETRSVHEGLMRANQFYQTASIRFTPLQAKDSRLRLEAFFKNYTFSNNVKSGAENEAVLEEYFYPYFETPEVGGMVQVDYNIVRAQLGVRAYFPPDGNDTQVRPFGGLHLMFR